MMHLIYATYQYFPDFRTNTFQSMSTINEFLKLNYEVDLIYPNRKKQTHNEDIKKFYNIEKDFNVIPVNHLSKNTYATSNIFNRIIYLINHSLYAYKLKNIVRSITKDNSIFFTRSAYITYSLGKLNKPIVYEIHQLTKISTFLIKLIVKDYKNILFVPVSPGIEKELIELGLNQNYIECLETGYDEDLFQEIEENQKFNKIQENKIRFIYGGSLTIQGIDKGIKNLIECFHEICIEKSLENIFFDIYCSNFEEKSELSFFLETKKIVSKINIYDRVSHREFLGETLKSDIGIIPLPDTHHVNYYSSSMKYFEFVRANLFIMCSDVLANKRFPYEKQTFYKPSKESIKQAILASIEHINKFDDIKHEDVLKYSFSNRTNKIISKLNHIN